MIRQRAAAELPAGTDVSVMVNPRNETHFQKFSF
jgi:hypothetical protein